VTDVADPPDEIEGDLARKMGRTGAILAGRRVIVMAITAVSTAVTARYLGPSDFGEYSSAIAVLMLLIAMTDFGFSLVLGRDMVRPGADQGELLRTGVQLQATLGGLFTIIAVAIGVASGLDTTRGQVICLLAPLLILAGLGPYRQIYLIRFRVRVLAIVDITTNVVTAIAVVVAAAATSDPLVVAVTFALGTVSNTVVVAWLGRRQVPAGRPSADARRRMLRAALPLGAASVLSSLYLTIDLVILGWVAEGPELGAYAAAVKFLSLMLAVPTVLLSSALPGLSMAQDDREHLGRLVGRVTAWILLVSLFLCATLAMNADLLVDIAFGSAFDQTAELARILALAGVLGAFSGVLGMLLTTLSLVAQQLYVNVVALALTVGGTILLVPTHGVVVAAWLTAGIEALVILSALVILRGAVPLRHAAAAAVKPLLATVALAAVALALHDVPLLALVGSVLAFLAATTALRGWPDELRRRLPGHRAPAEGRA
jgi:O-antigen/teichoic acid export membrane protein